MSALPSYYLVCRRALMRGIPRDRRSASGDTGHIIDATLARYLGWPRDLRSGRSASLSLPLTRRLDQAARRLSARLGTRAEARHV